MKKIFILGFVLISISISTLGFTGTVDIKSSNGGTAYTVVGNGSTTAQATYTLNETPWLYINLPSYSTSESSKDIDTTYLRDQWNFGTRTVVDASLSGTAKTYSPDQKVLSGTELQLWISPANWSSIKQVGSWEIYDIYYEFRHNGDSQKQKGSYTDNGGIVNFTVNAAPTVTPEPISMALFGLGAGVLGLAGIRRKKSL